MCPPHSAPSKTNRRAPVARNWPSNRGDGTCRNVAIPAASSAVAWLGRPPAMITAAGLACSIAASWAARVCSGANPRMPAPQGRSPSRCAVAVSMVAAVSASARASARNGMPPASATADASSGWSLTLVIGPCTTGSRVPSRPASTEFSANVSATSGADAPATAARTAATTPATSPCRRASSAAR